MEDVMQILLKARDQRYSLRKKIAGKGQASVSLTLNIPGYPKSTDLYNSFFNNVLVSLKDFLLSHRVTIDLCNEINVCDADGDFFLAGIISSQISISELKLITEQFEAQHLAGRFIDVDLVDDNCQPVSSGKAKACFICKDVPAICCMRNKAHSMDELRSFASKKISEFLFLQKKHSVVRKLSAFALKGLLQELSLSPKPGLVDRYGSGSHRDMDFATFLNSSAVLSVYFSDLANYAFEFSDENLMNCLPKLRQIGLLMERDMFSETKGVNTHKGVVFLMSFCVFACAYLIAKSNFSVSNVVAILKLLNNNVVEKELAGLSLSENKTHGEICFQKYGLSGAGIRGQIQEGLPLVFNKALPVLKKGFSELSVSKDKNLNIVLRKALLSIMAENPDSNILFRKGQEVLEQLMNLANKAFVSDSSDDYKNLIDFCKDNHVSPGGSADLLAVSMFMHYVCDEFSK